MIKWPIISFWKEDISSFEKGGDYMTTEYMVGAEEVAKELGISRGYAYKLIKKLNDELSAQGYIVISGKLPKAFLQTKFYGFGEVDTVKAV